MASKVNASNSELCEYSFQALQNHIEIDNDPTFYGLEGLEDALLAECDESLQFTNLQIAGSTMDVNSSTEFRLTSDDSQTDLINMGNKFHAADTTVNKQFSKTFIAGNQNHVFSSDNYSDSIEVKTSKNLISERRRRRKLNEKLFLLRALVPSISKMDKASIVADAIAYLENLHKQIQEIEVEISGLQSDTSRQNNVDQVCHSKGASMDMDVQLQSNNRKRHEVPSLESDRNNEQKQCFTILELEVSTVEQKTFLLRISCKKQAGVVKQLAMALESVNVVIINANLTSFEAHILNTLFVEADVWETMQADRIKQEILTAASKHGFTENF